MGKRILVIGDYGREHALAWKIAQSPTVGELFIAPGNGGTQILGTNVPIHITDGPKLADFAEKNSIDFTIASMDATFEAGVVDVFNTRGLKIFGPTRAAAEIEWSKAFAKELMRNAGIPTASFDSFTTYDSALAYLEKQKTPIVLKVDGLARGKGVYVCNTQAEAKEALVQLFASSTDVRVVIEEFLEGEEISIHALTDGMHSLLFPASQDHKRIGEKNTGPNTGGIGAIVPVPAVSQQKLEEINQNIVTPVFGALAQKRRKFAGCLYPGLMLTPNGPKVLEFNARFGDPECQVYVRLLKSDLLPILEACADGGLTSYTLEWNPGFAVCVYLVSAGYPGTYSTGFPITGIAEAEAISGVVVFHAGTKMESGVLKTNGGRVLNVSAVGDTLEEALDRAYRAVECIHFAGMYYRRDIGARALAQVAP